MRVKGNRGLYFQDFGGGFFMQDNTWIRIYGNKSFYHNSGTMRTDGTFEVGPSGNRFRVISNGNVGIGTSTPAYKLDVSSGVKLRKTTIGVTIANADNSWIRDDWLTGSYGPAKWDNSIKKWVRPGGTYNDIGGIVFQDEGTYLLRKSAGSQTEFTNSEFLNTSFLFASITTGNIGIGTNIPGAWKLAVKGKIRAEEIKVETGWADYVFSKDYDLPSLKEVEKQIKEKGHLKNIPSAKEVAENGILLGEMNKLLLEKIEELVLYTIQQQKEIDENTKVSKRLSALENENQLLLKRLEALEKR